MAQSPENNHDPVLSVDCQALLDENRILKDENRILKDEIRILKDEIRALNDEVQKLKARLEEPEELQRAISEGDLDALVMPVSEKDLMVFTLNCTDQVYHIMMEKANEDVVIVDAEFKITNVGKRLFNKTGYSQEEVIGRSWLDFVDEASKAVADLHMEKRRQGIDGSYEAKLIRKDGSPYWAIISVKPLFDNDGNFKGTLSMLTDITDRKQAEEALRESEMRYRMLFDKSMDAIILTDPRGVGIVLSANPAACKMLGWTLEELILKGLDEIFYVKNPALSTLLDEHIPSGSAKSQVNYRHKDVTTLTGEVSSTFFIDRNGEPRAVTIMRDITGRKQAEKALQESEAKYRDVFETVQEIFYIDRLIYDEEGNFVDWIFEDLNPAGFELLGLKDIDDAKGKRGTEVLGHEAASFYLPMIEKARRSSKAVTFQYHSPYVDKEFLTSYIVRGDRLISAQMDVTELKQVEEALHEAYKKLLVQSEELHAKSEKLHKSNVALKESEGRLRALFNLLPIGVSITDKDRNILDANLSLENILGLSRSDLLKKTQANRKHLRSDGTEMPAEEFPSVRALKEEGSIQSSEMGIIKEDGNTIWTDVSAVALPFPVSKLLLSQVISQSASGRKRHYVKLTRIFSCNLKSYRCSLRSYSISQRNSRKPMKLCWKVRKNIVTS